MLSAVKAAEEPLTAAHRAQLAYIYARQPSAHQVRQHQKSTELQYRLVLQLRFCRMALPVAGLGDGLMGAAPE